MRPYYDDGTCTIYHGDALEFVHSAHMNLQLVPEVLVTDPPYGIRHRTGGGCEAPVLAWFESPIPGDMDTNARDAILAWWGDRPALVFGTWKAPRPAGVRALLVWDKTERAGGTGNLRFPWKNNHEEVYVLGPRWGQGTGWRRSGSVLRCAPVVYPSQGRQHPHEKPVELLRGLVAKCPPGTILDPFMGSGPVLRAAKDLGRRAIGIEIEERYCEIAAKRLGQEVLDLSGSMRPP